MVGIVILIVYVILGFIIDAWISGEEGDTDIWVILGWPIIMVAVGIMMIISMVNGNDWKDWRD